VIIGYSKIGRSWNVNPASWSTQGGDADVWRTLWYLATRNPDHTFLLTGRNTCEVPQEVGLPPNVINPWTERQPELRRRFNAAGINHPDLTIDEDKIAAKILWDMSIDLFLACDQHVVWCGQHGTSSAPIRQVKRPELLTHPQDSTIYYCSYLVYGLNAWQDQDPLNREACWLLPDVRNYIKMRDLRWPLRRSVVAQYDQVRQAKHERFDDSREFFDGYPPGILTGIENEQVWVANTHYTYDALELTAIKSPAQVPLDLTSERKPFGMLVNENRKEVSRNRLTALTEWVLPNFPDAEIFGRWTAGSQEKLGITITEIPYDQVYEVTSRYRCTLTTPASGSGWATAKPWESFLAGTICFFHPAYDDQGHIIPTRAQIPDVEDPDLKILAQWLRPPNPEALRQAVDIVSQDFATWSGLAQLQRKYVERVWPQMQAIETIEGRIGLG
jgi:hypothetical protein